MYRYVSHAAARYCENPVGGGGRRRWSGTRERRRRAAQPPHHRHQPPTKGPAGLTCSALKERFTESKIIIRYPATSCRVSLCGGRSRYQQELPHQHFGANVSFTNL